MNTLSARSLLTGWFFASKHRQRLVLVLTVLWVLIKSVGWLIRHPRYSVAPVLGLLVWIETSLFWGLTTLLFVQSLIVFHWAWALLGKSEIDTWPELIHGLPRLWRLHRAWPHLVKSLGLGEAALSAIVVTAKGVSATLTCKTNSAHLKKHELDLAAGLRADRATVTPTSSWQATLAIDWGKSLWGASEASEKQVLYGLVDEDDNVIYVGITAIHRGTPDHLLSAYTEDQLAHRAAENRLAEHRLDQPWADEISATQVLGVYASREEVRTAETDLIRRLGPTLYNKEGNEAWV